MQCLNGQHKRIANLRSELDTFINVKYKACNVLKRRRRCSKSGEAQAVWTEIPDGIVEPTIHGCSNTSVSLARFLSAGEGLVETIVKFVSVTMPFQKLYLLRRTAFCPFEHAIG